MSPILVPVLHRMLTVIMDSNVFLQSLTEAFDIIKDLWATKSVAIVNCIVETEAFDGVLAMEMWAYILRNNESLLCNVEESKKLVHNVLNRFYEKYETYGNNKYKCRAIIIHIAPHIVKCEFLIKEIFGKTTNAGHARDTWNEFIPMLIAGIILQEDVKPVQILIQSLTHNNKIKDITIGQLLIKANEYIETIVKNLEDMDKSTYKVTTLIKNALLESVSMIKDKITRAECKIAVLSF